MSPVSKSPRNGEKETFFTPLRNPANPPAVKKKQSEARKGLPPIAPVQLPSSANRIDNDTSNMVSLTMQKKIREAREKTSSKPNQLGDERKTSLEADAPVISSDMGHADILRSAVPPPLPPPQESRSSGSSSGTQYSDVLRNGNPIPWQVVTRKGKRNTKMIVGTHRNTSLRAAVRTLDIFTTRWSMAMTPQQIQDDLKRHSISAMCTEVVTKATRAFDYKSFKITVKLTDDINIFDPSIWTAGVRVSKCYSKPKTSENNRNSGNNHSTSGSRRQRFNSAN